MVKYGPKRLRPVVAVPVIRPLIIRIVKVAFCTPRVNKHPIAVGVRPAMVMLYRAILIQEPRLAPRVIVRCGPKRLPQAAVVP